MIVMVTCTLNHLLASLESIVRSFFSLPRLSLVHLQIQCFIVGSKLILNSLMLLCKYEMSISSLECDCSFFQGGTKAFIS
jgi:hypothetical protein